MITGTEIDPLLGLLHLCDSLFPIGGFAHSDGLEAATESRRIATTGDLGQWLDVLVCRTLAHAEGPGVSKAWRALGEGDEEALLALDAELNALRPSSTARLASRAMGARLLKTWHDLHATPRLGTLIERHVPERLATLPVAFGAACAAAGVDRRSALAGFFYTRMAATVSSAMRLMPLGQHEAHRLLAAKLGSVPPVIDAILAHDPSPSAFAPALDIASMSQQYVRSRLFLS